MKLDVKRKCKYCGWRFGHKEDCVETYKCCHEFLAIAYRKTGFSRLQCHKCLVYLTFESDRKKTVIKELKSRGYTFVQNI